MLPRHLSISLINGTRLHHSRKNEGTDIGLIPFPAFTEARNGKEAVDIFEKSPLYHFDVILMDVMMPVMDGLTATRQIRAMKREDAKTMPIFAMTANAFQEDIQASHDAGMTAHLSKPLNEQEIYRMINRYVNE